VVPSIPKITRTGKTSECLCLDRLKSLLLFFVFVLVLVDIGDSWWFSVLFILRFFSSQICVVVWTHNLNVLLAENGLKKWCCGEECVVLV
jgi:hypothetical protein